MRLLSRPAALLRVLSVVASATVALLTLLLLACLPIAASMTGPPHDLAAALLRLGAPPLAMLVVAAGPLWATRLVNRARSAVPARAVPAGVSARRAALLVVLPAALAGIALATAALAAGPVPALPMPAAIAILVLAFPLLVAERTLRSQDRARLPEAAALRRLALGTVLATFATGLAAVASGLDIPLAALLAKAIALTVALCGLELALRAAARGFLPPGPAAEARAVSESILLRLFATAVRLDGTGRGSAALLLREQLGLDFSRSWALRYLRVAALPITLALLLCAWGLSGLAVVPVTGRAVYLRLGVPVAVLRPGLHVILPWPLGITRATEWGAVHELALGEGATTAALAPAAEAPLPVEADRLWDRPHPGELTLLVASTAAAGAAGDRHAQTQLFQSVSADIRVLWRVGLDDRSAILATTATADPVRLLRADAARILGTAFAGSTLPQALGADREQMAAGLRLRLQALLWRQDTGLDAVAVIVEAIHPPAGAAEAYHAVRAAEIVADAAIYAERGRAVTVRAQTRQYAFGQQAAAQARAAETTGGAHAILARFSADAEAARHDGPSFLFERRMADLVAALSRTPLTILDRRLAAAGATTLDLRPPVGGTATTGDGE